MLNVYEPASFNIEHSTFSIPRSALHRLHKPPRPAGSPQILGVGPRGRGGGADASGIHAAHRHSRRRAADPLDRGAREAADRVRLRRVKEQRPNSFAILLPTNQWEEVTGMALANHAALLNADGTAGAFRDRKFVEAFRFFVRIFKQGLAPPVANTQVANVYQGFAEGDFAMFITGPWNVGEFRKRLPPEMKGKWMTA